jgi:hypothetical protein
VRKRAEEEKKRKTGKVLNQGEVFSRQMGVRKKMEER